MTDGPQITVVLCTYNRAEMIERTVRAVLDQQGCVFELVVVDDGSTDATPKVLASIGDDRMQVVRQTNAGPCAARNTGLARARGRWTVFLDDDDLPEPGWLAALAGPMDDPSVGISCCGATAVDPNGDELFPLLPVPLGEPFGDVVGRYLGGTFAVRTELVRQAGGYLVGLGASQQFEMFVRLMAVVRAEGLTVAHTDERVVRIERRPVNDRRVANPRLLYDGVRWILSRHPDAFAGQRSVVASFEGVIGASAARLDDWPATRRHFLRAARSSPRSARPWGRLALAAVPFVGRRVWNRHGSWEGDAAAQGVVRQDPPTEASAAPQPPELFLPWRYEQRSEVTEDDGGGPGDERAVQRLAERMARKRGSGPVAVCAEVVERAEDPVHQLHRLAEESDGAAVIISTPDRAIHDPDRPLGPPTDRRHRRQWNQDEFELLLLSTGFRIERVWRVGSSMAFLTRPIRN